MDAVVDPALEAYAQAHSTPDPPWLQHVAEQTRARTSAPQMMVGPLEGRFLAMLVAAARPRLVVELGTFTGYSALSMAAALPPGGRIVTCEADPDHAALARHHIGASPYADRIDLRQGDALETLAGLDGPYDLVFLDADKESYVHHYEAVLPKLGPDGLVVADNTLWYRRVLDPGEAGDDPATAAVVAFNRHVAADERVECVVLTVRDGVTLIRRRR